MKTHELKTDPNVFQALLDNTKRFEVRKNDRGFEVGDKLSLLETEHSGEQMANGSQLKYTGRSIEVTILYILRGPIYGLAEGWVIMSIA